MIHNKHVDFYIDQYKKGKILFNDERIKLVEFLENHILQMDELFFDEDKIEKCITYIDKYYFELQPFQKFLIAFIFLYEEETMDDGSKLVSPYFNEFYITLGRGGGKNGLISGISNFMQTSYHGIDRYDISIVANSEDQAKTSFNEVYDMLVDNKLFVTAETPFEPFKVSKTEILSLDTRSKLKFNTSNAKTKDGGREGCVIFDEIHIYEDSKIVDVKRGGLGKVPHPRTFYLGTKGHIREGFMDALDNRATAILLGKELEDRLFPFICKLDKADEVNDSINYQKANPMFHPPLCKYAHVLYKEVHGEYKKLRYNPSGRSEFMTKRMNFPEVDESKVLATWEEIMKTQRDMPDLTNRMCIGGVDYATVKDFAAVGLLFRIGEEYVWKSHSFVREAFLKKSAIKAPIREWHEQGYLTIVDEPSIHPQIIVNWFIKQREEYGLEKVIMDNYRADLLRPYFQDAGIEIEIIRNPRAIHDLLHPRIETIFANELLILGDNPLMRWYINNVAVKVNAATGKREYIKKDEFTRKTDGFHAMLHAIYRADEIQDIDYTETFDLLEAFF
ncbi:terminase large subunit [Macrococcoides bohemicum]|uniref:Terminase large subunit n=1 Tax=Macrococcoides bohemicum TaxID=1903056 RepID=A0AAJ4TW45_9STAP|nr:terminase TerL endonuclease subunit [Macrococcus bohemicus]QYA42071.1 terminase large subunit [Macrococcus bohemicus]